MKIALDLQLDEAPLFIEVGNRLVQRGVEVVGIALGRRWAHLRREFPCVDSLATFARRAEPERRRRLREIEERYGILLNHMIGLDRSIIRYPEARASDYAIALVDLYERLYGEMGVRFVYGPGIAFLTHYLAYALGPKLGGAYIEMKVTRTPNDRFVTCDNDRDRWDLVDADFERRLASGDDPSEAARGFLEGFASRPTPPAYMNLYYQKRTLQLVHLRKVIERLRYYYVDGWGRDPLDYYTRWPGYYVARDLGKIVRARCAPGRFERPVPGDDFVLFPLQYQPEASTTVLAPDYDDQVSTIRYLAKRVPRWLRIYVKEHRSSIGTRARGFYHALRSLPNVRLIHPGADTLALVREARAVVTLTSTVGWEAILLGRRPLVLGEVFFLGTGLARRVVSYADLADAIADEVAGRRPFPPVEHARRAALYIDALLASSYDAKFTVPGLDPSVMTEANLARVADAMATDLERRAGCPADPVRRAGHPCAPGA